MGKIIVTTGRGGTGKTTFAALATRYLSPPLLLIDIDPDQSLGDMLGIDFEKEGIKTVLDILYDIIEKKSSSELDTMPLPEKIEYLYNSKCLYESKHFDFIALGVKWTKGCYCAPNNFLRQIIPRLSQNYTHILIDAPAGLEHLNRKITSEINDLFLVLDPSMKSLKNIQRVRKLTQDIKIQYQRFNLVTNYRFTEDMEGLIRSVSGNYLGRIEYDADIEDYNLQGKSILELPEGKAALSVKKILATAGYKTA